MIKILRRIGNKLQVMRTYQRRIEELERKVANLELMHQQYAILDSKITLALQNPNANESISYK